MDPADVYWSYKENAAPAARAIQRINSFTNTLIRSTTMEVSVLIIDNVCIMN